MLTSICKWSYSTWGCETDKGGKRHCYWVWQSFPYFMFSSSPINIKTNRFHIHKTTPQTLQMELVKPILQF